MLGKPSKKLKQQLEESGKRANAVIVEIAEKGLAVTRGAADNVVSNTEIALKTHLRVQPEDEPEFEVKKRLSYPQLSVPSAGQTVPVIYDPEDHDKIIVDYSTAGQEQAALSAAGIDADSLGDLMNQAAALQQAALQAQQGQAGMPGMTQPAGPAQPDPVGQLERLAALKEKGALTEAEFEAEKAKILGQ